MADDNNSMPPVKRGGARVSVPSYRAGVGRSVARLEHLKFDPIGELVEKYREVGREILRQNDIRDGLIVELKPDGKPRYYNSEAHMSLHDKQINIAKELLRYGYGRVPEMAQVDDPRPKPTLVVNLTKKGDTYVVNDFVTEEEQPQHDGDVYGD